MTQTNSDLEIYLAPICPFAHRSWLALEIKGLTYTIKECSLKNKQSFFTEAYGKALGHDPNSNGKVPVLRHGDQYLTGKLYKINMID